MKSDRPRCEVCGEELTQPSLGRRRRYCSRSCQARAYRARQHPAPAPHRRPVRPQRLTMVAIVRAAVDLADREGLDGLSMRRLATDLGVATTSLYRHFPDRDALLAEMAELALAETPPPPADLTGWRTRLSYEAHGEWQLYRRHPWMLPVLAQTRPPMGPTLLDHLERSFAALYRPGMTRETMLAIYLSVSGLVQGLALLLNSERTPIDTVTAETRAAETIALVSPDTHPMLFQFFEDDADGLDMDLDKLLDDCLALLFDGVAIRHFPT
ncbi:TetR/AcrR family transcriptional regulator [Nocardia uniformis]|uniref:TetR/AcrR family transcriptional regulator n=1 Tax=Nocardia uniformis TaxID=53432 RepID=A0A849CBQ4_9NOCA|nr:TetR/AcrR family transcriptional regulator [Nocardia uniformis]NNH72359.1 TetR/AcrR family transcriptional regulator [Nocardia uniformis]